MGFKVVVFTERAICALMMREVGEQLPKDVRPHSAFLDGWTKSINIVIKSAEFPDVPEGAALPILEGLVWPMASGSPASAVPITYRDHENHVAKIYHETDVGALAMLYKFLHQCGYRIDNVQAKIAALRARCKA